MRVGIDLVDVAEVRRSAEAFGERYLRRVFTPGELADCGASAPRAESLAARFAAKEAAFKALRATEHLAFHEVEVTRGAGGAPALALHGETGRRAAADGVVGLDLSITHERGLAAAVVAITCNHGTWSERHDG